MATASVGIFQLDLEIDQEKLEQQLNKKLGHIGNKTLQVGFLDNQKMYERAYKNEYGFTEKVELPDIGWRTIETPARPFMFVAFHSCKHEYVPRLIKALKANNNMDDALLALGADITNDIHDSIDGLLQKWEQNAPYTIFMKGRDQPLVDTGEMKNSVNCKVTNS